MLFSQRMMEYTSTHYSEGWFKRNKQNTFYFLRVTTIIRLACTLVCCLHWVSEKRTFTLFCADLKSSVAFHYHVQSLWSVSLFQGLSTLGPHDYTDEKVSIAT